MSKFRFSIDRGGTFTDIYAEVPAQKPTNTKTHDIIVYKLLSEDPTNYKDAPTEGIKRIMEQVLGVKYNSSTDIDVSQIEYGTTVATNALLERKGERCVLITSKGFKDLLQIGNQSRPHIFDLVIQKPSLLYEQAIEINERVRLVKEDEQDFSEQQQIIRIDEETRVEVLEKPNETEIRNQLQKIYQETGIRSLAVVLIHSFIFREHEILIGKIAKEIGFENISLSHEVMPMIRAVPRGLTTCVDAYLTPIIKRYVANFLSGFTISKEKTLNVTFMQSDGGLTPATQFKGSHAILSGPAGGVVGVSSTAFNSQNRQSIIAFDMGGTSTDVSRYSGVLEHIYETNVAGVIIQAPQLDIQTVAAGGGSRLFFRNGLFVVGPESSGSHPGPVCYRKNGFLAVTDANLFLGRILPQYFPKIFGKTEKEPLDEDATKVAFLTLTDQINQFLQLKGQQTMTPDEVAYGFIKVANESMCRPIRNMTVAKGYDTRDHVLACFGGAGAQHACDIARSLGITKIHIHKYCGVLSAYGLSLADVVREVQEPCSKVYSKENLDYFSQRFSALQKLVIEKLKSIDDSDAFDSIETICYLNMRYIGTDYTIMVNVSDPSKDSFAEEFERRYKKEYGFTIHRQVVVDDIRVRGIGKQSNRISDDSSTVPDTLIAVVPQIVDTHETYFEGIGRVKTPVYDLLSLQPGTRLEGPCIIIQKTTTIIVNPNTTAAITMDGSVMLFLQESKSHVKQSTELDSVQLSIFNNRFMSIAEQMGRSLQRTSISTNIKERLDFSCAIFSPDGGLVANAPHLPVHLGSMSEAVRYQIKLLGNSWKKDEVILMNHPKSGGTHLPDLTVITPVYNGDKPVFYVANRAHHADIGGIAPGSMPPFSRYLREEGAAIESFKLVKNGEFQLEGVQEIFKESRLLHDNISDLKAQVAANQKGIFLINSLIEEYTLDVVHAYMTHVQNNAELAVREMLKEFTTQHDKQTLNAVDFMDDGTRIELKVTLHPSESSTAATFDFTGTSEQMLANTNAPKAVTLSAILYCLRCMIKQDIPLNEGCLKPIRVIIPPNSILDPSDEVGVVAGNVLTSQRLCDVILKAFETCAASQGCMNNMTFGNSRFGYYETVCGGAGAGPTWQGADCVQVHMTNTRITDVEILEKRYPVLLRQFSIRQGSGGRGKFRGGNGCVREYEFLATLQVGILAERRVYEPYGLCDGENGKKGYNYYLKYNPQTQSYSRYYLGSKNTFQVEKHDRFLLLTPGGGGWGAFE